MAKTTTLRGTVILKENTRTESLTNRILSIASDGTITDRPAISASGFVSSTLPSAQIIVGNGSNVATAVAMSGVIAISNAGVTSIVDGSIVNADVNASAAIAYSKLSLTGGIVNADINAAAAIAYSKLNLATSIVNADVAVAAGIARSKTASGTAYRLVANNASGVMSENAALTPARVLVADVNGQPVAATPTTTEINYVSGVTSAIQTQLNTRITGKATNALVQAPTAAEDGFAITWDDGAQEWALTDPVIQGIPVAGTISQVLMKDSGADYDVSWTSLLTAHITDITATAAELNILDGATLTVTELNYVDGVTSNIQTQLDAKQSSSLAFNAIWVGNGSGIATQLSPGTSGYVLTSVGGAPQWQPSLAGHIIENSGTPLTSRANLNFSNGLTASDNTPDTDVKLGGALTGHTYFTGAFDFKLGNGGNIGNIEFNASTTLTANATSLIQLGAPNIIVNTSAQIQLNASQSIYISNSSSPPSVGDAGASLVYSQDVDSSSELFVMNEAGVETKLSGNKGNAGGTLHVDTTTVGNVTGGEDDLKTYTIPADTLDVNGQSILATCSGTYAANVNNKTIKVYLGSTLIFNSGVVTTSGAHWNLQIEVIRTGASAQKCVVVFNHSSLASGVVTYTVAAEDTTSTINLRVTGESAAAASDDIVSEMFKVKWEAEEV